jgi:hypothetical protein
MKKRFRRIRAAVLMGVTWALLWAPDAAEVSLTEGKAEDLAVPHREPSRTPGSH